MEGIRRAIVGAVLGAAGLGACLGPTGLAVSVAPSEVLKVSTREGRFPNGMRVIFETIEDTEVAGAALAIDGGSANDPEGESGLAHLVEHCVFQAHHGSTSSVQERLRELAADYNAFTTHDLVEYHAFVPRRAFDDLLQVIEDIATEPLANVAQGAFDHEKQVVEAERGVRNEDAQGEILGYLYAAMFPQGHPYARPVSGTQQSVASLTLDDAHRFVARSYDPKRVTLYVAAPLSTDPFKKVSDAFAARAGGPLVAVAGTTQNSLSDSLPVRQVGPVLVHEAALPFPELWLSWPLPASSLQDRARAELLTNVTEALLRPTFTSHPAVAHAGCELNEEALSAVIACRLVLNDAKDAEGVLDRTLADLRHGFGQARGNHDWVWEKQRDLALDSTLELEGLQGRTVRGAEAARVYGNPFLHQEVLNQLPTLDLGQVSSLGYAMAERGRTFSLLMKPQASGATAGSPAAQEAGSRGADDTIGVAPDAQHTLALVKSQSSREISQFELSNGLTVISQRRRGTPFVSAILGFRGGYGWAKDPAIGLAAALAETWHVESSPSLAGLSLRWDDGEDDRHFVARAVAPDLKTVLDALSLERNPHLEWPSLRFRRMLPALTSAENSFERIAMRKERSALFGNHPYAAYTPAARADSVTGQALARFFGAVRRPDNAVLVVVSDTDPEQVRSAVQTVFGKWSKPIGAPVAPPPAIDLQTTRSSSSVIVVNKAASQVELKFACLLEHGVGAQRVAEETLADALRRQVHSTLRDQTGIVYYASANFRSLAAGVDEISLQTTVDKRHVAQALAFFKSLRSLQAPPISETSLAWLRFQNLQAVAFRDETTKQTADALYGAWLEHTDLKELEQWPTRVAGVSLTDLIGPLQSCTDHSVIVAVGDQATIEQADKN